MTLAKRAEWELGARGIRAGAIAKEAEKFDPDLLALGIGHGRTQQPFLGDLCGLAR